MSGMSSGLLLSISASATAGSARSSRPDGTVGAGDSCCLLPDGETAAVISLLTTGSSGNFSSTEFSASEDVVTSSWTLTGGCSSLPPLLTPTVPACSSTWSSLAGAEVVVT